MLNLQGQKTIPDAFKCHRQHPVFLINCFSGVFFTILSGNGKNGYLSQCKGKNSIDEFKNCILKKNTSFIRGIDLQSYEQATVLTDMTSAQIIIPEDGSVGLRNFYSRPTFHLDPLFVYRVCLYDKDFLLPVSNPFIIPRTCVTVGANTSVIRIPVKVNVGMS